jgi:hypothetical protein
VFFSSTRLGSPNKEVRQLHFKRVRVSHEVIEAASENGGLGIWPLGAYEYNYRVKCSTQQYWKDVAKSWNRNLKKDLSRLTLNEPDADDDTIHTDGGLNHEGAEILPNRASWVQQSAKDETRFIERQLQTAVANERWHVDLKGHHWDIFLDA